MAWRRQHTSTSIDVDIDEFNCEALLQGLINANWISATEAEAIMLRARKNDRSGPVLAYGGESLVADMETAIDELHRGRPSEALIYLERYLGRRWTGVLAHG